METLDGFLSGNFLSCFRYQAPGKSKSPVQFGDEDWELAWEDDPPKAPQRTMNGQVDKETKIRDRGNDNGKSSTSTKKQRKAVHANDEGLSEKGANGGLPQDSTSESHEGHLEGADLKVEQEGSQRTDAQRKSTQRRPKNYGEHKPKVSPHKKHKSEDS